MKVVESGWLAGEKIHTARKEGRCHYWLGREGQCTVILKPGDAYVYGEHIMFDNPFERERFCLAHLNDGR